MKKFVLVFLVLSFGIMFQSANAQISIAPEFGLNFASLGILSSGKRLSTAYSSSSLKTGVGVGATINYDLNNDIYLESGLFYKMTGAKISQGDTNITYSVNTIEIPVNAAYKFAKKKDRNYFFVGIGIYLADNLSGKLNGSQSRSLNIGSTAGTDDFKAIDLGAGLNIGRVVKYRYLLRLHSQFGFTNLYPGGNADNLIKTYAFGITVGYFVSGKSPKKTGT